MEEVRLTIPGYLPNPTKEEQSKIRDMLFKFGNARRRAYNMIQKGIDKSEIERRLQRETGLNARYVKDAIHSTRGLPSSVTFGGKKNQELREKGKIAKEEYHRCRNAILISCGEKSKNGNLNLRIVENDGLRLRVNVGAHEWIYPQLYIPQKYLDKRGHLLDGSKPYQVVIKRRGNDNGYDVRITVKIGSEIRKSVRIMALDVNSGHIDYAVLNKDLKLIQVGKIECHALLHASTNKRENLLYKLVNKIARIARHFDARVIVGKLNTGKFSSRNSRANRKVKQMPQFKFRQILKYKLPLQGVPVEERSEAHTTKLGQELAPLIGLDAHKASAIMFALKTIDHEKFNELRSSTKDEELQCGVRADEDDGSPSARLSTGSGLTVYGQRNLAVNEVLPDGGYPATPGSWGLPQFAESLKPNLAQKTVKVKI